MLITLTNIGDELLELSEIDRSNFVAVSNWDKTALEPNETAQLIATLPNTGYTDSYMDFIQSLSPINSRINVQFNYHEKVVPGQIQSLPLNELSGSVAYDISPENNPGVYQDVILNAADSPIGGRMPEFVGNSHVDLHSSGFSSDFNGLYGSLCFFIQAKTLNIWSDPNFKYLFGTISDDDNFLQIYKLSSPANVILFDYSAAAVQTQQTAAISPTLDPIHLALTWSNPSDRIIAYVNGIMATSDLANIGAWAGNPALAKFGNEALGGNFGWEGYMSQYRLYDRELTAQEVSILANT